LNIKANNSGQQYSFNQRV